MTAPLRCDLFCSVVDNFGDAGVCWRLARQLAAEHGWTVRLWIDDPATLAPLSPDLDVRPLANGHCARLPVGQSGGSVEVRHWTAPLPATGAADIPNVVIEAFACNLPDNYIDAMADRSRGGSRPVWLNLEYLSAEAWVESSHGLPSPHPRLPLLKHFFFPGFASATGGLLRERDLLASRNAFGAAEQTAFLAALGVPPRVGRTTVSLFCYDNPALPAWLDALADDPAGTLLLVAAGKPTRQLTARLGPPSPLPSGAPGWRFGTVEAVALPFVPQDDYDRLLWCCDLNFVRGEDSFVRAQWAARSLVWHIYPQQENAHLDKLEAFLGRYLAGGPLDLRQALVGFHEQWNGDGSAVQPAWRRLRALLPAAIQHATAWCAELAQAPDLAANLAQFCKDRLECRVF